MYIKKKKNCELLLIYHRAKKSKMDFGGNFVFEFQKSNLKTNNRLNIQII